MRDQPEHTEEEQEQVPARQEEEDAMRGPGGDDPEHVRKEGDDA